MKSSSKNGSEKPKSSDLAALAPCTSHAAFWSPRYLVESSWLEHGPFSFWLIQAARPKVLVELGTHSGFSYLAFCQAVKELGLSTSCFAIDTWLGGEHAELSGEEAYKQLAARIAQEYSAFSQLLRCRFDEALPYFANGTVDLLHIDGRHTYEDARTDFETWKSKLSSNSVVLFHDTNVREGDFGVWRLWSELARNYPSFEFLHGQGLGVLAVGPDIPPLLRPLFEASAGQRDAIRSSYARLGRAVAQQYQLEQVQKRLGALSTDYEVEVENQRVARREFEKEIAGLADELNSRSANAAKLIAAKQAESEQLRKDLATAIAQGNRLSAELEILSSTSRSALARVELIENSTIWRTTGPLRATMSRLPLPMRSMLRRGAKAAWWAMTPHRIPERIRFLRNRRAIPGETADGAASVVASPSNVEDIAREIFAHQQSEASAATAAEAIASFAQQPLISIVMPVYKTPVEWLRRAIESLQEQFYPFWELCVVDDCSPTEDQRNLLKELAAKDSRIRIRTMEQNGGISAASNLALDIARGQYIALLDHDDELTPDALFRIVEAINTNPNADFIYSDECKIDDTPARNLFHFIFKPDWSPEIMFNAMVTGHLTVYSRGLVDKLGGFRSEYDFSQDYDLALRASEVAKRIVHVERILYLWRAIPGSAAGGGKDFARESNIAALNDALRRRDIPGTAVALPHANCVRINAPAEAARVSIVIPSDSRENLQKVLQSLREGTNYENYEVIVVCNGPLADRLSVDFSDWPNAKFVKYDKKYNFSDKCNEGADAATGEIVIFYNDDVFPIGRDWVERLIEYLCVPGVGGVSPKLLHEDNTIQYAGMISGTPGLCGTAYNHVPHEANDHFLTMHKYVRNVSILSGACCAFKREVFLAVGGFDAVNTPDGHSDMDLSYKLIEAGYRCVYTPYSILYHIGNHSWGAKKTKYKADIFALRRWGGHVSRDPYFTDSMKCVLYHEFKFPYKIHAGESDAAVTLTGPDVLLVAHELTLTGAPRMLFYAALAIKRAGGFPVIASPSDGPLRLELVRAGITVIVDGSIRHGHFLFKGFARNFDLAVANTVDLADAVRHLSSIDNLRTVWWLHEGQLLLSRWHNAQGVNWARVQILCISNYAKSFVPKEHSADVLHNGIPDRVVEGRSANDAVTFVVAGTLEKRKGQDIFVDAIAMLPEQVRRKCKFIMTGKLWSGDLEFWNPVQEHAKRFPEIEYLGLLGHEETLRLIASSDVLVCPSRDEPFSLVVAEAAMLSKPAIVGDRVGIREVFKENSALYFESGNASSLSRQLLTAYERRDTLPELGQEARRVFETELSLEIFGERFMQYVHQQISAASNS